jgi:hypothetical protein
VTGLTTTAGNTATLTFTSDEAGTYYFVVLPNSTTTTPTATDVYNGSWGTDTAAAAGNSIPVSGLTPGSKNTAYIIVQDSSGNRSAPLAISGVNPLTTGQDSAQAAANGAALAAAPPITATVPKADGSGDANVSMDVSVTGSNATVELTLDGNSTGAISAVIGANTITLTINGVEVTLGYIINDDRTLTITGGLDQIPGAGLADGPVTSAPGSVTPPTPIPVTGVTLSPTTLTLTVGATGTLTPTVAPDSATNQAVSWSSDKTTVATVTNGIVTAVSAGKATITVTTTDNNKTATAEVTVSNPAGVPGTLQQYTLPALLALLDDEVDEEDVIEFINGPPALTTFGAFYDAAAEDDFWSGRPFTATLGQLFTNAAGTNHVTRATPLTVTTPVWFDPAFDFEEGLLWYPFAQLVVDWSGGETTVAAVNSAIGSGTTFGAFYTAAGGAEAFRDTFENTFGRLSTDAAGTISVTEATPLFTTTVVYIPAAAFGGNGGGDDRVPTGKTIRITSLPTEYYGTHVHVSVWNNSGENASGGVNFTTGTEVSVPLFYDGEPTEMTGAYYVGVYIWRSSDFVFSTHMDNKTISTPTITIPWSDFPTTGFNVTKPTGSILTITGLSAYNGSRLSLGFTSTNGLVGWAEADIVGGSASIPLNVRGGGTALDTSVSYVLTLDIHGNGSNASYYSSSVAGTTLSDGSLALGSFSEGPLP